VIAAFEPPADAAALAELGGAVAAAVLQRRRLAVFVQEQHDVLTQQREGLRCLALQAGQRHGGVPELAEDLLLAGQHSKPRSMKWMFAAASRGPSEQFPTALRGAPEGTRAAGQ
jgi:hypothetical protein